MKQTAVEWLLNAIETKNGEEFSSYYSEFIDQAKEIEKQQMIEIAKEFTNIYGIEDQDIEEWYNETYGGNKWNYTQKNK